ncbi:MAG: hypothetical protein Q9175_004958 [Cornicularia normoerica]
MDASPLTLAQTHARKASKANTPTAAIDEHDLAAGQFATAAKGTDNSEVRAPHYYSHSPSLIVG